MGVHGLLEVVFYLKATLPLVGLAAALAAGLAPETVAARERDGLAGHRRWRWPAGAVGVALVGLVFARPLAAAGYANLGAVLQTRQEMSVYHHAQFDNPTLDAIRVELNLDSALQAWERAVELQPGNRTALQRLAQVALSRGAYAQALAFMKTARQAGHDDQVTRLLYADALAASGAPEAGAELLGEIPWAEGRLFFQGWYRYWLAEDYGRAADVYRAILTLEPENEEAQYWLEQAEREGE
jgi:predicted Zn-dependent protease